MNDSEKCRTCQHSTANPALHAIIAAVNQVVFDQSQDIVIQLCKNAGCPTE